MAINCIIRGVFVSYSYRSNTTTEDIPNFAVKSLYRKRFRYKDFTAKLQKHLNAVPRIWTLLAAYDGSYVPGNRYSTIRKDLYYRPVANYAHAASIRY